MLFRARQYPFISYMELYDGSSSLNSKDILYNEIHILMVATWESV